MYNPGDVPVAAVNFSVLLPDPGAIRLDGVKVAVRPNGSPLAENETAELNPPLTATVSVMELLAPGAIEIDGMLSLNCSAGVGTVESLQ